MLTVISPAKKLDMDRTAAAPRATQPRLLKKAGPVADVMRRSSPADLAKLMKVSPDIASLNAERYRAWSTPFTTRNATRAILAFDGDVYSKLERDAYAADDFTFAQKHVRILSGLYGLLRPLDLIQAYRLEMGSRVAVDGASSLYEYWGDEVTRLLRRDLTAAAGPREGDGPVLVNLASDEYFGVVRRDVLDTAGVRVIKPVFKENRGGAYKVIAFSAKRARGMMVDFVIRARITDADDLRQFDRGDYAFASALSSDDEWVFTRG